MNRMLVGNDRMNHRERVKGKAENADFLPMGGDLSVWIQDIRACLSAVQTGMEKVLGALEKGDRPVTEPLSLKLAVTDIREVVESVRHPLARTAALAAVELEVELPEEPCLVWADAPALSRMLVYLLMDALCFAPSCVTLRLRVVAGREVEVCISDNGQDRFSGYTGNCAGYGPLVRLLAVAMRGELRMESVMGKGTMVAVAFAPAVSDTRTAVESAGGRKDRCGADAPELPASQAFLDRVTGILEAHLSDMHFTVDVLAQELGMSRTAMFVKLKEVLGMTPNGFVRFFRLQKAAGLLMKKELQVSEVCFQVGFSSPSYFTRCFQQQYGMKPAEYKKKGK